MGRVGSVQGHTAGEEETRTVSGGQGREWARGSCGGGADSPARWGRGSAPGMPRRGDWAGLLRPRPRAGSQWARRRRVTEGAEVRVRVPRRRRRRTAQPEREGLGGARGSQCRGGDPGARRLRSPGPPGGARAVRRRRDAARPAQGALAAHGAGAAGPGGE